MCSTTIQPRINIPPEGSTIPDGASSLSSKSNKGAIAGGVVGGILGAALIGAGIFFCVRRRRNQQLQEQYDTRVNPMVGVGGSTVSPASYTTGSASGRGKLPGFSDGASFEPFTYSDGTRSHSQAHLFTPPDSGGAVYGAQPVVAAGAGVVAAQNVRDSTYFRTHRPGESDDIGPSASQVGSSTSSGSRSGAASGGNRILPFPPSAGTVSDGTSPQQVMLAKQSLVNEELRSEVDNLRRDLERIREERRLAGTMHPDEAPPSYDDPI